MMVDGALIEKPLSLLIPNKSQQLHANFQGEQKQYRKCFKEISSVCHCPNKTVHMFLLFGFLLFRYQHKCTNGLKTQGEGTYDCSQKSLQRVLKHAPCPQPLLTLSIKSYQNIIQPLETPKESQFSKIKKTIQNF